MTTTEPSAPELVVVEPPMPATVRRPRDLLRMLAAVLLAGAILAFASLAVTTASGLEQDLIGVATGLPGVLLSAVQFLGGLGLLLIPVAVSIDLLVRRQPGQMLTALLAAGLGAVITVVLRLLIETVEPGRALEALTKVLPNGQRTLPLDAALAAVVALLTVAQLSGRTRWQVLSTLVVSSVAITVVLSSGLTLVAAVESILLGWLVGLAVRYVRGSPSDRPDGAAIARALAATGLELARLERIDDDVRGRRRYSAVARTGEHYVVHALDRDQEGAGLLPYLWRSVRVIRPAARPAFSSVRRGMEHEALLTYAAMARGASVVQLVAATEVGTDAAAMAFADPPGESLAARLHRRQAGEPSAPTAEGLTDSELRAIWRALERLHRSRIAHRSLVPERIVVTDDGQVLLRDLRFGEFAASDFTLDLDVAELLTTTASMTDAARAVDAANDVVGQRRLSRALPLLQPLSMSATTRKMLRGNKGLLTAVRSAVVELVPDEAVEQQSIRRFSPRTVFSVVGLAFAAYFLLPQLSSVNFGLLIQQADWRWALIAVGLSGLTYVGAAMSLIGYTPHRLRFLPTMLAQYAVTYYGLFAPSLVSGVAINTTYLQRSGVYAGVAVASVGVSQLSAVLASVIMIIVFGALAGTGPQASFTPSEGVLLAVAVVVAVVVLALSIGPIRRYALARIRPVFSRVVPRLLDVLQSPRALAVGFSGNVLMNIGFIFAMVCAIEAFGGDLSIPTIALVLLAGVAVGSAVPTPGGIGAIEAALTAGLTAAGLDGATALSSVLLYRTATFWIPVPIGFASQAWLGKRRLLFT